MARKQVDENDVVGQKVADTVTPAAALVCQISFA